ncbi:trichome birefringence-like 34 [Olea europaea subsp. europaea]|uniref:Trichome birefringence-like 34 n=1 Tax=Olea europaea subsp. europaea TaxID=158383 RepID=A0A8S0TH16_OLEEU|nr:trichome birefringence-like 34 [Olea europaea subsp. europaea]
MAVTQKLVLGTWKIRYKFHSIAVLLLIALVIVVVRLKGDSEGFLEQQKRPDDSIPHCNFFSGKWVYDNISYPLYKENQCSFMELDFACQKFGRKDLNYQKWRWQPHDCELPRFNSTALLENLRGKKLVFVGDSLNRNQWTSMLCLIESSIPSSSPSSSKSLIWKGNSILFKATDYNATIQFYWSPFLVESNCDEIKDHRGRVRIIRPNAIEKHARQWTDADILVFDSFVWWEEPKLTLLWGSFESSDAIYKEVGRSYRHYEMALNTWSDWLEININRSRTKLFFMSLSPHHRVGEDWGRDKGRNCYSETQPVLKERYQGSTTDSIMMQIVESTIHKLETRGVKVKFLNITQLTDYRKDAHPSVYKKFWMNLTEEQLAKPESYSDCVHWCLPGVPDVWNVILFSYIMHS